MQVVGSGWSGFVARPTRRLNFGVLISWMRTTTSGVKFFTINQSRIGGADILKSGGTFVSFFDKFGYGDYTRFANSFSIKRTIGQLPYGTILAQADIELDNTSKLFFPNNDLTIGSGILPNRPIKLSLGFEGELLKQFAGFTGQPELTLNQRTVTLHAFDVFDYLNTITSTSSGVYINQYMHQILAQELNRAGFSATQYIFDSSLQQKIGYFSPNGLKVGEIFKMACEAEQATAFSDENGLIRFWNRQHFVTNTLLPHYYSLQFDGSNDSISFSRQSLTGAFTVAVWVNTSLNNGTHFFIGDTGTDIKIGYTGNKLFIRVLSGGTGSNVIALDADGDWHLVVVTRDAADKIDVSVDNGAKFRLFSNVAQSGTTFLGYVGRTNTGQFFNGYIEDVRIWNRQISDTERDSLYKYGVTPRNGLVIEYKLNEGTGTVAYDTSGNVLNGTINGGAVYSTFVPNSDTNPVFQLSYSNLSDLKWQNTPVINDVIVRAKPRSVQSKQKLWGLDVPLQLPPNQDTEFFVDFIDENGVLPITSIDLPLYTDVATTSFYATNIQSDGSGVTLSSSVSLVSVYNFGTRYKVVFRNTSSSLIYLTKLDIYGTPARVTTTIEERYSDPTSIDAFGRNPANNGEPLTIENNLIQDKDTAYGLAYTLVKEYGSARKRFIAPVATNFNPAWQIGDYGTLTIADTNETKNVYITGINAGVDRNGKLQGELELEERSIRRYFTINQSRIAGSDSIAP